MENNQDKQGFIPNRESEKDGNGYTKGEWKAYKSRPHDPDSWEWEVSAGNIVVASTMNEANANLIAAAPKQNQALIWVAEWLGIRQPDGEKPNRADVVRIVNEALAKAGTNDSSTD